LSSSRNRVHGTRGTRPRIRASSMNPCGASCRSSRSSELDSREDRGVVALVHHLAIGRNVPFAELVRWLRGLDSRLVIEFAGRDDPMVQRLLAAKRAETHEDYGRDQFERALREAFELERQEELSAGTRTLYLARPRA